MEIHVAEEARHISFAHTYVARHAPDQVTEAMDRVCAELGVQEDRFVASASRRVLKRSEW